MALCSEDLSVYLSCLPTQAALSHHVGVISWKEETQDLGDASDGEIRISGDSFKCGPISKASL